MKMPYMAIYSLLFRFLTTAGILAWLSISVPAYGQSSTLIQLKSSLQQAQSDSVRALTLIDIGRQYIQSNLDSSWYYLHQAINISKKLPNKRILTKAYNALATTYVVTGESGKGLAILRQAEQISRSYPFDSTRLEVYARMTQAYRIQGDYQQALRVGLALDNDLEKHPERRAGLVVTLYSELAIIHQHFQNDSLALLYYRKAFDFAMSSKNKTLILVASGNLGEYYVTHHEFGKAEFYLKKLLAISQELNLAHSTAETLRNIGEIKRNQHQYKEAISYYEQALSIQKQIGAKEFIGYIYLHLAESYSALNNPSRSLYYLEQSIAIFQAIRSTHYLHQALLVKVNLHQKLGHFDQALQALQQAQILGDSLSGLEKQKAITQIQAQFDLERKQNQIANLKKDLTLQQHAQKTTQLQLSLTQSQRTLYFVVSILLLLVAVISYINFYKLKKSQKLLSLQRDEIRVQNDQLLALNRTKDQLFSIVSHDLRNPLVQLKQEIRQILTAVHAGQKPLVASLSGLEQKTDNILTLLITLLDWAYVQFKGFQTNLQVTNLTDHVAQITSYFADRANLKQITIINQVEGYLPTMADPQQLGIVLRNLVDNAIKFTPVNGYIRLLAIEHANTIELQIRDTGIGMTAEMIDNLFTQPQVRQGTLSEIGTGLGLKISNELLAKQNAKLVIERLLHKGVTVKIFFEKPMQNEVNSQPTDRRS
jgi:signal transduction histidine kinase